MKIARSPLTPEIMFRVRGLGAGVSLIIQIVSLAAIFALDLATAESPVQHLYYLPIVMAALRFNSRGALLVSSAAVILYHLGNPRLLALGHREADVIQILVFFACGLCTAKLAEDSQLLRQMAVTDDLTGLSNLRGFEGRLSEMVSQAHVGGGEVSMLVLDVDRLKKVNDSLGHLAGADAVRLVGMAIAGVFPEPAAACRYGGDEFAIAVSAGPSQAAELAERLCRIVRETSPTLAGHALPVGTLSISVGLASLRFPDNTPSTQTPQEIGESLFRAADAALYQAKRAGRDRVATADLLGG